MKKIYIAIFIILIPMSVSAKEWYTEGTLHSSTIKEWKKSTHENKVATSADWVLAGSEKIKSKVMNSGNIDNLKPYSEELVVCIDGATKDQNNWDNSNTTEVAISCMALMGWIK